MGSWPTGQGHQGRVQMSTQPVTQEVVCQANLCSYPCKPHLQLCFLLEYCWLPSSIFTTDFWACFYRVGEEGMLVMATSALAWTNRTLHFGAVSKVISKAEMFIGKNCLALAEVMVRRQRTGKVLLAFLRSWNGLDLRFASRFILFRG